MRIPPIDPSIHQAIISELLKDKLAQQEPPVGAPVVEARPPVLPDVEAIFGQGTPPPPRTMSMRDVLQQDLFGFEKQRAEQERLSDEQWAAYQKAATAKVAPPKTRGTFDKNDWWKMLIGTALSYLASKNRGKGASNFIRSYTGVKQGMAEDENRKAMTEYEAATRQQGIESNALLNMASAGDRKTRDLDARYNRLNEQIFKEDKAAFDRVQKELANLNNVVNTARGARDIGTVRNALTKINTLLGMPGSENIDSNTRLLVNSWEQELRKKQEEIETEESKQRNYQSMIEQRDAQIKKIGEETKKLGFEIDIKELDRNFLRDTYDSRVAEEAAEAALETSRVVTEKLKQGKLQADTARVYAQGAYRAARVGGRGSAALYGKATAGDVKSIDSLMRLTNTRIENLRQLLNSDNYFANLTPEEANRQLEKTRNDLADALALSKELSDRRSSVVSPRRPASDFASGKAGAATGAKLGGLGSTKAGDLKVKKGPDGKPVFYK